MDISEGVIVHALFEVDRIEDLDVISTSFQQFACFQNDCTLGISHDNGISFAFSVLGCLRWQALHDVRLDEESGFTAAGTADDDDVLVSAIGGTGTASAVHGQAFCFCEYCVGSFNNKFNRYITSSTRI